ncbi:DUF3718 domain-containing protein [Alteromonas sp. a30]|uniref:DUF3718 domain-containing protein n=1 Tax=Alteromonas sp. a30 TaxID=2730917 RepID=UPI00227FA98B|nr:DUF3718 domain-containing protein [Alteromonas sp. a30]MCY7296245.1 DUF3718 domain-containing protein [Alteromonas sp. a30]
MNKSFLKIFIVLVTGIFSFSSFADINEDLANICTIVKNDDKSELRKKLNKVKRDYSVRVGDYYTGISCGGESLIRYAMSNGSNKTGEYIIKKMRKSDLDEAESDGKTVKQWAEENGHIGSPIGAALLDRLN